MTTRLFGGILGRTSAIFAALALLAGPVFAQQAAQPAPQPQASQQELQSPEQQPQQPPSQQPSQQQPAQPSSQQPAQPPSGDAAKQDQPKPAGQNPPAADKSKDQTQDQSNDQSNGQSKDPSSANNKPQNPAPNVNSSGISKDRLFFTLPNYLTIENSGQLKPLTPGQKFKAVARGAFDPIELGYYTAVAGISQAANSEPGYGQGAQGYGKRYGATFADGTIENFMVGAVMPSILRTDPRYYQQGKGGFFHRSTYAISRLFVTRTDSGHSTFNFSEIFGSAIAAGISTYSYHPGNDRTVINTTSVWGTQVGQDGITLMLKEFWPDIRRKFDKFRKK